MALGDSVGLLAAVTALVAATYRYIAVLGRRSTGAVERSTAFGFFTGLMVAGALIIERSGAA